MLWNYRNFPDLWYIGISQNSRAEGENSFNSHQNNHYSSSFSHPLTQCLQDTSDLADLQEEAEKFREMLGRVGAEIEHLEESSKEKLQIVCRSLNKWLQYCDSNLWEAQSVWGQ